MAIVRKKQHKTNRDKRVKTKYCKKANSRDNINNKKTQKGKKNGKSNIDGKKNQNS